MTKQFREQELDDLAKAIDCAGDRANLNELRAALLLIDGMQGQVPDTETQALLHYFAANAWSGIQRITTEGKDSRWDWEQEELEQIVINLRSARSSKGFRALPKIRKCQILTNLGNILSHIGRFVEAIEYWDQALEIDPQFGMAIGNRGYGVAFYASLIEHSSQQVPFVKSAHSDLKVALSGNLEGRAASRFREGLQVIESGSPADGLSERQNSTGMTAAEGSNAEKKYRKWCLSNRLFLNPLNDIEGSEEAARDILTAPSMTVPAGSGLEHFGQFNQIKQEFVSARYLYYQGVSSVSPHYADKNVLLYDTLDFPAYSLAVERVKLAFRSLYSIFDKIAFFLNSYLALSIAERKVNFRSLWYSKQRKSEGLLIEFRHRANWPLRGLFWLSKDLYEDKLGFRDSIEPDGQALAEIRNHLEHKYLKVHQVALEDCVGILSPVKDSLAYSISRNSLEVKTLKLLKMVRAALIYLALIVRVEEKKRLTKLPRESIAELPLGIWRDAFKV